MLQTLGSDRSSGTDPVLTPAPCSARDPRLKPIGDFRPIRAASGGVRRPRCEDPGTPRPQPPWPTPRKRCAESERRALVTWIRRTRLSCVWRGLLFATPRAFHFSLRLKATNPGLAAGVCLEVVRAKQVSNRKLGFGSLGGLDDRFRRSWNRPSWELRSHFLSLIRSAVGSGQRGSAPRFPRSPFVRPTGRDMRVALLARQPIRSWIRARLVYPR